MAVVRDDWARRITVIDGLRSLACDERAEIVDCDGHLFADSRRGFGGRDSSGIAETYHVRMVEMHERLLVRLHPCLRGELALFPAKTRVPHEIRSGLRRRKMQDIVVLGERLTCRGIKEVRTFRRRIHPCKTAPHGNRDLALLVDLKQTRSIVRNIIQLLACGVVLERAGIAFAVLAGELFCEQADLLRRTAAFVLGPCVGEDAASSRAGELVHGSPSLA